MKWVVKASGGERYLHSFDYCYGKIAPTWTEYQMFAWRFVDRNAASVVAAKLGDHDTTLVRLKTSPLAGDPTKEGNGNG